MTIASRALADVLAHARESDPRECCGMLIGTGMRILAAIRAKNLADTPNRYLIDPKDHINARRSAREGGLEFLGFYHSHPRSEAFPSVTDLEETTYPECVYMIVGMRQRESEVRCFRFGGGSVSEEKLEVE